MLASQAATPPADDSSAPPSSAETASGAADLLGNHNLVLSPPLVDLASAGAAAASGYVSVPSAALLGTIGTATDALDAALARVDGVGSVLDHLAGDLPSANDLADNGGDLLDGASGLLAGTGDLVGSAVTPVTPIGAAGAAAVHDLGTNVQAAADDLPLAGTDPAGGVSTLVDLVQTSELFTIGQADVAPEAEGGGSIVDALIGADDAIVPPVDDASDLAHHLPVDAVDDLHLGL